METLLLWWFFGEIAIEVLRNTLFILGTLELFVLTEAKHLDLAPGLLAFAIIDIRYQTSYSSSLIVCVVHELFLRHLLMRLVLL